MDLTLCVVLAHFRLKIFRDLFLKVMLKLFNDIGLQKEEIFMKYRITSQ